MTTTNKVSLVVVLLAIGAGWLLVEGLSYDAVSREAGKLDREIVKVAIVKMVKDSGGEMTGNDVAKAFPRYSGRTIRTICWDLAKAGKLTVRQAERTFYSCP